VLFGASLAGAPAAAAWWHIDARVWPFLVASILLEVVYFTLLGTAYGRAELSVVYPIARGLAPVLVLVGTVAFTGAHTSALEVAGVLLVGCGILLVRGTRRGDPIAVVFGLLIASLIATYTIVDKHGVRHATPLAYLELMNIGMAALYAPLVLVRRTAAAVRAELSVRTLLAGAATTAGYALVLAALRLAPAASVSAVRESSVLLATALAAIFLRERVTRWRMTGAALVAGGVALVSLF
jgi:drug/metabolite transporter (DMT)-like permease